MICSFLELLTDLFIALLKVTAFKLYDVESLSLAGCIWLVGPEASEGPGTWIQRKSFPLISRPTQVLNMNQAGFNQECMVFHDVFPP